MRVPKKVDFLKNLPNEFERKIYPFVNKETFARPRAETPTRYINGFLRGEDVKLSAVHMVQTTGEDMEIIRGADIGIVLCPRSNVFLRVGKPNLRLMIDHERVGLGTDGLSSNSDLDFFREIRFLRDIMVEQGNTPERPSGGLFRDPGRGEGSFYRGGDGESRSRKKAPTSYASAAKGRVAPDPYSSIVSSGPENLQFSMVGGNLIYRKGSSALAGISSPGA